MAPRNAVTAHLAPAFVVGAVLAGFVPLLSYALMQGGGVALDGYVWRVLRFTLWQATLSTLLSVIPALFLARALARRAFWGRALVLALFNVPLALPAIVAVLGIVHVYGASGWFAGWFTLYGLPGILIAHVFFNMPLATQFFLRALEAVPVESHRLAAQQGFSDFNTLRHVDWPVLRTSIGPVAALVFLLCAASFVIVLTLGGGPQATTLEVAIFQSLRMDFDLSRAASLSLVQIVVCGALVVLAGSVASPAATAAPLRQKPYRHDGRERRSRIIDAAMLVIGAAVVIPPVVGIVAAGVQGLALSPLILQATLTSVLLATAAAVVSCSLAWSLAQQRLNPVLHKVVPLLAFIIPPAVIATGWFILTKSWPGGVARAVVFIVILNALMALPYAVSALAPHFARITAHHDRLCEQLGISGWTRLRRIDAPAMARPLVFAFLLALVVSLGDLTAVMLLGSQGLVTMPSLIAQQMGAYRGTAAGGTALLLVVMCYSLTLVAQRIGRTA